MAGRCTAVTGGTRPARSLVREAQEQPDAAAPASRQAGGAPQAPPTQRPVPGAHLARLPKRRAPPTGRGHGRHLIDNACQPDDPEYARVVPTPVAATLMELPTATSAVLDHDLEMRADPLAFHLIARLDPDRRRGR